MPELPEVEIVRRNLERWLTGGVVTHAALLDEARFEGDIERLIGRRSIRWDRHGKMLLGRFSDGQGMLSHLGMTGKWVRDDDGQRTHRRIVLTVLPQTGPAVSVALVDTRRFGRTWVGAIDDLLLVDRLTRLGPDALAADLDGPGLAAVIGPRKTALKRRLLDQAVIAGLGNIAVVEACWRAAVHPHTRCDSVLPVAWQRLADAIQAHLHHVLDTEDGAEVIYMGDAGATNPFLVYGRAGTPCPRCGAELVGGALGGRPSVWCPQCQPQ